MSASRRALLFAVCGWCQNSNPIVTQGEFHRAISHELAIEFDRNILIAADPQSFSLKIFHFRQVDIGAEKNILQIFDDLEITNLLERDHIQPSIVEESVFKERKRSAVSPAVTDQKKRSFIDRSVRRLEKQTGRLTRGDLRSRDEITQRPEIAF